MALILLMVYNDHNYWWKKILVVSQKLKFSTEKGVEVEPLLHRQ